MQSKLKRREQETVSIPSSSSHGLRLPTPKQWSPPSSSFLRGQPLCEPTPTPPGSIPKTTAQWTPSLQPPLYPTRSLPQPTPPAKQPHNLLQLQPGSSRNNSSTKNHQTGQTSPATSAASTPSHTTSNNLNDRRYTSKQEPRVQSRNPLRLTKLYPVCIRISSGDRGLTKNRPQSLQSCNGSMGHKKPKRRRGAIPRPM